ncbi:uncharacterized protein LOC111716486 [Eurytemora carolleeae]|uniref:uncharacterized protein LOC111716486 n=1 Tax=Eurytemora carolleeae TaxID=1294199 RepID=UPI000C782EA6|nr:uncharacterized protein LOC111716486 [Eurytemora carolleeae]|eukprot:XP_023347726.1 uncharacterized protein LOC111716486 [Eurytemora affinis]
MADSESEVSAAESCEAIGTGTLSTFHKFRERKREASSWMKLIYRVKLGGEGRNLAWLQAGHTPVTDWDVVFQEVYDDEGNEEDIIDLFMKVNILFRKCMMMKEMRRIL